MICEDCGLNIWYSTDGLELFQLEADVEQGVAYLAELVADGKAPGTVLTNAAHLPRVRISTDRTLFEQEVRAFYTAVERTIGAAK